MTKYTGLYDNKSPLAGKFQWLGPKQKGTVSNNLLEHHLKEYLQYLLFKQECGEFTSLATATRMIDRARDAKTMYSRGEDPSTDFLDTLATFVNTKADDMPTWVDEKKRRAQAYANGYHPNGGLLKVAEKGVSIEKEDDDSSDDSTMGSLVKRGTVDSSDSEED